MASSPGKWEVVGRDGKPRKNTGGNKKNKTKVNEADLPKLDIKAPIPESKTQFDAFSSNEQETFVIPKQESDTNADNQINSRYEVNRKIERKPKHHTEPQQNSDAVAIEALKKCDLASIERVISESKQKYPNNALVLLKDLTGFLQQKFIKISVEKDPVLGNQTPDFPLCCLASDAQEQIIDELKHCSEDNIDRLFTYCLDELLIEINKGHATFGIRVIIQCILKCCPYVTIKNEDEYLQRVNSRKDNPREALSLLWVFGQTSDHEDLEERMTVWSSFLLPLIESKQLSKYVVDYLETTLSLKLPEQFTESPISGEKFQHIMEITYGSSFMKFPYRRQLQLLYPEIKAIVFAAHTRNTPLTDVFSKLFDSLSSELGKDYVQEVLNCLLECLEKDATCHYKWRNSYLARMKESSLLLRAIVNQWETICRSVPQKYLVETLREFQIVNEELKERDKPKAGLLDCERSCKTLLDVISNTPKHIPNPSRQSTITQIFKLSLVILFLTVCVDMYKHRGYQGSKTSEVLKQYGVEKVLVKTVDHGKLYALRVESWAEKRYPHYYKKTRDVVEPACDYIIAKLGQGLHYIANVTAPARQYIHKNVPPLLEKFEGFVSYYINRLSEILFTLWHNYSPVIKRYLQRAWDTLAIWVPFAWTRAQELTLRTASWFYNLSPDFFDAIADGFRRMVNEMVTRTPHILALIQEYLLTAWKLLVSSLSDVVLWLQNNIYARSYNDK